MLVAPEPNRARAFGVEQTRRRDNGRAVVEERHKLYRAGERAQERLGYRRTRVAAGAHAGINDARAGMKFVCDFAHARERVNQFGARSLAVRDETRDAATVDATARDKQVVARAPRDSAQLQLALGGRFLFARVAARERESRVTLDALARGEERVPLRLAKSGDAVRV